MQLGQLVKKTTASFVVVYGRRRVGKSSMIEHFGEDYTMLSFEGLSPRTAITKQDQLDELSKHTAKGRLILLLDEISWMALEDADFPRKLKIAWDKYFKKIPNLFYLPVTL